MIIKGNEHNRKRQCNMKIVLGTMTFADQVELTDARRMLALFGSYGHIELDTAHVYNGGETETMLAKLVRPAGHFLTATKVHPWNDNGLKPHQVKQQLVESLNRLKTDQVDLLYLHSPDPETPITDTLQACRDLHRQGRFRRFGLSNFSAWQVAEIVEICRRNGWMEPEIYQGMYNALTRDVERELFPCLRNYGMAFYAYNPLAGGLLTGKHLIFDNQPQEGRFAGYRGYQDRYWKSDYFQVIRKFVPVCEEHKINPTHASLRWLCHHSLLSEESGDAIILGASQYHHLEQNLLACSQDSLPEAVVSILDQGWEETRADCFKYFRA